MGKISNQWLNRGQGIRNKSYRPVSVTVRAINPTDAWSKQYEIAVQFTASRPDYAYQVLHLTSADAENVADTILNACSSDVKAQIAGQLLDKLSDAAFHRVLADAHKKRVEKSK